MSAELVTENTRLVWWVLHRMGVHKRHDVDDLYAEGILGLTRAARRFDPSFGFKFSTYAVRGIWQHVHRYLAKDERHTRIEFDPTKTHPPAPTDDRADAILDTDGMLDILEPRERAVMVHRCNGETQADIGRRPEFSLSRERVRQIEAKATSKMRQRATLNASMAKATCQNYREN